MDFALFFVDNFLAKHHEILTGLLMVVILFLIPIILILVIGYFSDGKCHNLEIRVKHLLYGFLLIYIISLLFFYITNVCEPCMKARQDDELKIRAKQMLSIEKFQVKLKIEQNDQVRYLQILNDLRMNNDNNNNKSIN